MSDEPQPERDPLSANESPPTPELGVSRVAIIYGVMTLFGWGMAQWLLDHSPLSWSGLEAPGPLWRTVLLGAGLGAAVALLDLVLERLIPAMRQMGEAFYELLGVMTPGRALTFAICSAVGEEVLFRGWLLPWTAELAQAGAELVGVGAGFSGWTWIGVALSSVLFGAMHVPPDRRLWIWPLLAAMMGVLFGWLFVYTGDLLAPILAHFTINYFGFMRLSHRWSAEANTDEAP